MIVYVKAQMIDGGSVSNLNEIKRRVANGRYDFAILDLSICWNTDVSLLSDIRREFDLPIIVTAPSDIRESGRAAALELGADDCIRGLSGRRSF
jgi:DNA-binding response OmpR family regulator